MIVLTGGALKHGLYLAKNVQVDKGKMCENIAQADDVILAEAAVFALAKTMPRSRADDLVKKACGLAVSEGKPLIEVVRKLAGDMIPDGALNWQALAVPENYLGETAKIIDRVLKSADRLLG
jgi:3-carboxy-cis,cis-muconate cycloisomerase